MLVGGVALSLTGVGGPAGAAVIAAAAVNVSSAVVDVVAAHNPENAFLGDLSTTLSVASVITPQGAAKKIVGDTFEVALTQVEHHVDDVIDVAKTVPTPPTQLADEVANSALAKIPNAPPGAPEVPKGTDFTPALKRGIYDDSIAPDGNLYCSYCTAPIAIRGSTSRRARPSKAISFRRTGPRWITTFPAVGVATASRRTAYLHARPATTPRATWRQRTSKPTESGLRKRPATASAITSTNTAHNPMGSPGHPTTGPLRRPISSDRPRRKTPGKTIPGTGTPIKTPGRTRGRDRHRRRKTRKASCTTRDRRASGVSCN